MLSELQTTSAGAPLPLIHAPEVPDARQDGQIAWLLSHDDHLARLTNAEICRRIVAPIRAGHGRIWCRGAIPVGLAIWARLSATAEAAFLRSGAVDPGAGDGAGRLWLTHLVAPFGDKTEILRALRREVFPADPVLIALRDEKGALAQVVTCHGRERFV